MKTTKTDSGSALVTVIIFAAVAFMLAGGLYFATSSQIKRTEATSRFEKAFFVAEAGLEHAAAELNMATNGLTEVLVGQDTYPGTSDDGIPSCGSPYTFGEGSFSISIVDNDDGDGDPFSDTDATVIVTSAGTLAGRTRTIECAMRLEELINPPLTGDGALCVYGTNASIELTGSAIIDGDDRSVPGAFFCAGGACAGTVNTNNPSAPGVYSATTSTVTSVDGSAVIQGDPDELTGGGAYTEEDYSKLAEQLIPLATHTINGGVYAGNQIYGTRPNPCVTVITANTKFTGNVDGAGICIITAGIEIDFAGTFHYEGLVLFIGDGVNDAALEFDDNGNSTILGSVVAVGGELDLGLVGSSLVGYSSEALANLANLDLPPPKVSVVYWKEIK